MIVRVPSPVNRAVAPPVGRKHTRRVVAASMVGTVIETYDLYIYGTAAALVFSTVFFPDMDPATALIFSFLTFAASFVARPVGAIVLGHFGDRIGRKAILILSLLIMGIGTFLIAFLPGFETIGPAAPIILIVLRICQGIGFGGEWGGAITMVTEHAPPGRRAFFASLPQLGSPIGFILANAIFLALIAAMPNEAFMSWGWRIPFFLSILLVALGFYIRKRVDETPQFKEMVAKKEQVRMPFFEVLRRPSGFILVTGSTIFMFGTFYLVATFMLSYLTNSVGLDRDTALLTVLIASVFQLISIPTFGALAAKVGGTRLMIAAAVGVAIWAFPLLALIDTGNFVLVTVAFSVFMILHSMIYGPMGAIFPALFHTSSRYTGLSMGLNFGSLIGGGFAPLIAVQLPNGHSVAVFLFVLALVSLGFIIGVFYKMRNNDRGFAALSGDANDA